MAVRHGKIVMIKTFKLLLYFYERLLRYLYTYQGHSHLICILCERSWSLTGQVLKVCKSANFQPAFIVT